MQNGVRAGVQMHFERGCIFSSVGRQCRRCLENVITGVAAEHSKSYYYDKTVTSERVGEKEE